MKKITICTIFILSGIFSMINIDAQPNPGKVTEQMQKLNWMVGDWEGEAWYLDRDQKKVQLLQKEHIIPRLDGTILTMEGTGYDKPSGSAESRIVFQAFGVVTWDLSNSRFILRAYQGGNFTDSDLIANPDGSYTWRIDTSYGKTRYTIRLTPEGKWNETGEFSRDGTTWIKNFEMTLSKL